MTNSNKNALKYPQVQKMLNHVPLILRNFPPEELRSFLLCGQFEEYETAENILSKTDDVINDGILVVEGSIDILFKNILTANLRAGDFTGETFLFSSSAFRGNLVTTSPTAIFRYKKAHILDFFEHRSERLFKIFIMNILEVQQEKLNQATQKILNLQKKLIQSTNINF
jgi:CRP-like cAMP-binding protein